MLPLLAGIYFLAYFLRFEGSFGTAGWEVFVQTAGVIVATKLAIFWWFGVLHGWNRYVTFHDLIVLARATTVASIWIAVFDYLVLSSAMIPRSVFLIDWGITIVVLGALKSISRLIAEREIPFMAQSGQPVLIIGASQHGEALLRAIRTDKRLALRVVGFISEDARSVGTQIGGVPVIGEISEACGLAVELDVRDLFITAGELTGRKVRELDETARKMGITVMVLPSYTQLLTGRVALRPRRVSTEDLLGRDPVQLDQSGLENWLGDRVLLVTGAAGSIGSEICRQLLQFAPRKLILVDRSETGQFYLERELQRLAPQCELQVCMADITDAMRMNQIIQQHQPQIVFHAAAYKHVPLMESNVGEAVKNISLATRLLADLAHQHQLDSFVMISTDKAVNPTSVMGTCKRVAELYVQSLADHSSCRFVTVRFGNVLDSAGSVIPIFRKQINDGGPVTVTHAEMQRYFMTIPEASQLVIQAGAMGAGGEIFVLDMGEPVKIMDLAKDMIRLSGLEVGRDVDIAISGMRPGEKLYEELQLDGEECVPTSHPKIMVSKSDPGDSTNLNDQLQTLGRICNGATDPILAQLRIIVPQFVSGEDYSDSDRRAA